VIQNIKVQAYEPYLASELSSKQAIDLSLDQARDFMIRQTREKDLALMVETSGTAQPETVEDIDTFLLIPELSLPDSCWLVMILTLVGIAI